MKKKKQKIIVLFIATYIILYLLSQFTALESWNFTFDFSRLDYMFFLTPFAGFFLMYYVIDWFDKEFETTLAHQIYFPLLFLITAFIAYYIVLYYYYGNLSVLSGIKEVKFDFWEELRKSAFLVFVFSALSGWISHLIVEGKNPIKSKEKK